MLRSKSYFAAGVTLRGHEADLFPTLLSGVFVSLYTGLDFWCNAV